MPEDWPEWMRGFRDYREPQAARATDPVERVPGAFARVAAQDPQSEEPTRGQPFQLTETMIGLAVVYCSSHR